MATVNTLQFGIYGENIDRYKVVAIWYCKCLFWQSVWWVTIQVCHCFVQCIIALKHLGIKMAANLVFFVLKEVPLNFTEGMPRYLWRVDCKSFEKIRPLSSVLWRCRIYSESHGHQNDMQFVYEAFSNIFNKPEFLYLPSSINFETR